MTESGLLTTLRRIYKRGTIRYLIIAILPFLVFVSGYYVASLVWGAIRIDVPAVVGLSSHNAMYYLSQRHLYPFVMACQENAYVPEGTVVQQVPQSGQLVKPNQTIFLVTTCLPPKKETPEFVGMSEEAARDQAQQAHVDVRTYAIPSAYPEGWVFAQIPQAGHALEHNHVVLYVARRAFPWYIVPSFSGSDVVEVISFCHKHNMAVNIFTRGGVRLPQELAPHTYTVAHQKPIPGTFIDIQKPPVIQLVVADYT